MKNENKGLGSESIGIQVPDSTNVDETKIYDQDLISNLKTKFKEWKTSWKEQQVTAGEEFDAESYIEGYKPFVTDVKKSIKSKIVILLDHSSSITDQQVQYKKATLALCEVLSFLKIKFSVFAFNTTQKQVVCWMVKPEDVKWNNASAKRLAQIEANGGTPLADVYQKMYSVLKSKKVGNALRDPGRLIGSMFTPSKLKALVGLIAPLAGLPLLALGYPLLWIPMTALYLISNASGSGLLNSLRLAPFLPLLWCSIAVLIIRLRPRWASVSIIALLIATFIGFLTLSPFPGGAAFDESVLQVNEHTRIGEQIVSRVPADVPLTAQNGLGAHLAARPWVRLFPWYNPSRLLPSIVVLDEKSSNSWPLKTDELKAALQNMQMGASCTP